MTGYATIEALREDVLAIAQDAASSILEVYERDFDVTRKDDASPLTEADLAAHHGIVAAALHHLYNVVTKLAFNRC